MMIYTSIVYCVGPNIQLIYIVNCASHFINAQPNLDEKNYTRQNKEMPKIKASFAVAYYITCFKRRASKS